MKFQQQQHPITVQHHQSVLKSTPVDGLTIGFGTSSEESDATANSDPKGTTIGFNIKLEVLQLDIKRLKTN